MKRKLSAAIQFLTNPRLLLCIVLAWCITNGWSYVLFFVGTYFEMEWAVALAGAYLAFLWLPVSPEKLVTIAIAIALLRALFPNDRKTLAVLRRLHTQARETIGRRKQKRAEQRKEEQIKYE